MQKKYFVKFWWLMLFRGIVALLVSFFALFWTQMTIEVLVVVLGIYMIADGIFTFYSSVKIMQKFKNWWIVLLEGLAEVFLGAIILMFPITSILLLIYFVTFWLLFTGILEIWSAYTINWGLVGKWIMIVVGILSLIVAVVILSNPLLALLKLVKIFGIYMLIFGIAILVFAGEVKKYMLK